mmetsp:Transcript_6848/g.8849  ORF Transcript_6848/g.8849 Transcript_6848/m.8849 type:complete len:266 (-) Transcript_6848:362-1159(-)
MPTQERRVDPRDGTAYTFDQFLAFYGKWSDPGRIQASWAAMKPLGFQRKRKYRFDQGDRVVCNVGDRWLAGSVLSKDVEDPEDPDEPHLAYVVKTDAIKGFVESNTISAPVDEDEVVCRERCFSAESELTLTKWAAPITDRRLPLRFGPGDEVGIRVWDSIDGYEHWVRGKVAEIWPALPKPVEAGFLKSADAVPYKIVADAGGAFHCHRDDHTLIRLPQNVPRKPGKTISKRFENRELADGRIERFDHMTLRGRVMDVSSDDDK